MFDDQNNNPQPAGVPNNLPIGEPEDMFAGVDKDVSTPDNPVSAMPAEPQVPSAVGAGILKPKVENDGQARVEVSKVEEPSVLEQNEIIPPPSAAPQIGMNDDLPNVPGTPAQPNDIYKIKEPAIGKGIVRIVVALVVVVIVGGGGWWIYSSFINTSSQPEDVFVTTPDIFMPEENLFVEEEPFVENNLVLPEEVVGEIEQPEFDNQEIIQDIVDEQVLFGQPIDKDVDGLDDDREVSIGTDPNNWDSDGDELSDGDEVTIWKTNPLNPDTDGDTFLDGAEIKNGYNPTGEGKLFEIPPEEL